MSKAALLPVIILMLIFTAACEKKASVAQAPPPKPAQAAVSQTAEAQVQKVEEDIFIYEKRGRRDPFVSLVVKTDEKPVKGPTPLENYDIGAIKILGIVWGEKGYFAEVILPDGKAYTVKPGITIGLHKGKIQKITKGGIMIKENIKDYKGEMKPRETILKLREEEE